MIRITDKKECCGCAACVQRCPKSCISLVEDNEGFLYPKVEENLCIECGLCEKVCPFLNPEKEKEPLSVLGAKNLNKEERMKSSSGGVFLPLAREIINKGGVVFGAVFDENWEVHHVATETIEGVYPMMGSKYLQSRIENTYQEAEKFLKEGREVMFVGSPCQIAGLHKYLRSKTYSNLLAVDFICHGVPSPGVWRKYLTENFGYTSHQGKEGVTPSSQSKHQISSINFREKEENGWKEYHFSVKGKKSNNKNISLVSTKVQDTPYMKGFLADLFLRPACHTCKCKNGRSNSDLTIGDYWGISIICPNFDDDKGVSLIIINSSKGKEAFSQLRMTTIEANVTQAKPFNGGLSTSIPIHPKRKAFFELVEEGTPITQAVLICTSVSIPQRIIKKMKTILGNFISKS